jgi:hypothetical protein
MTTVAGPRKASNAMATASARAHTAEEIICVVGVAAPGWPSAVAIAPAIVAGALKAEVPVRSPSR